MTTLKMFRRSLCGLGLLAALSAGLMLADRMLVTPSQAAVVVEAGEAPNSPATQSSVQSARSSLGHVLLGSSPSATQPAPGAVNPAQPAPAAAAKVPPADSVAEVSKLYEEMNLPLGASGEYSYTQQRDNGPKAAITGQIITEDGSPLGSNASIYVMTFNNARSVQGVSSSFTAEAPVGRVWLMASASGWAATLAGPFNVTADKPLDDVSIVLTRGQSLQVQVTDPKGQPIAGAQISTTLQFRNLSMGGASSKTDDQGLATINNLSAAAPNSIYISAPEYCSWSRTIDQNDLAEGSVMKVVMAPARPVVGHVIAKDTGKPIANAQVYISDNYQDPRWNLTYNAESYRPQTQTDDQGNFILKNDFNEGSRLLITSDDHRSLVTNPISPGQEITCNMPAPLYVHGHFKGDLSKLSISSPGTYEFQWANVNPISSSFYGGGEQMSSLRGIAQEVDGKVEFDLPILFPGKLQITANNFMREIVVDKPLTDLEVDLDKPDVNVTNGTQGSAAPAGPAIPAAPALHGTPAQPASGRLGGVAVSYQPTVVSVGSISQTKLVSAVAVAKMNPSAAGVKGISPALTAMVARPGVATTGSVIAPRSLGLASAPAGNVVQVQDAVMVQPIQPLGATAGAQSHNGGDVAKDPNLRQVILKFIPPAGAKEVKGVVPIRGVNGNFGDEQWLEVKDNQVTFDSKPNTPIQYNLQHLPGAIGMSDSLQLPPGKDPLVKEIKLMPAGAIRCTVVDEADQPVNVRGVQAMMPNNWNGYQQGFQGSFEGIEGSTDTEGEFLISPVPLNTSIFAFVSQDLRQAMSQPVTLTSAHPVADVKIVIPAGQTVKVHVSDADGHPAGGRRVQFTWSPRPNYLMGVQSFMTDGAGDVILNHINLAATAGKYYAQVRPGADMQQASALITADQPEITLQIKRGLRVHGTVIDVATGRPVVGVNIQANPLQRQQNIQYFSDSGVATDEEGHFEFTTLSEGDYQLNINGPVQMKSKPRLFGMGSSRADWPTVHGGQAKEVRMEVQPYPGQQNAYRLGDAPTTKPATQPATQPAGK